jgi:rRNA-processing protein FCF1
LKKIILDTNALMLPYQFKLDLQDELSRVVEEPHELAIPSGALLELEGIAGERSKNGVFAKNSLEYWRGEIAKGNARVLLSKGKVDDWIVHTAASPDVLVCTNDSGMRARLKGKKLKAIVLRERSHLAIV